MRVTALAGWFVKNAALVPVIVTPARAFFALCLATVTFRLLASRLHPSIVFSGSYLRLVAKLVLRPRIVQAIRGSADTVRI